MKKLAKRLSAEAEVDSIDSVICACDSLMLMRLIYADARGLLGERQVQQTQDDDLEKMA
jgi:hypothetical protein